MMLCVITRSSNSFDRARTERKGDTYEQAVAKQLKRDLCGISPNTYSTSPSQKRVMHLYPFLAFDPLVTAEVPAGIDDQLWLQREEDAEQQAVKLGLDQEELFQ